MQPILILAVQKAIFNWFLKYSDPTQTRKTLWWLSLLPLSPRNSPKKCMTYFTLKTFQIYYYVVMQSLFTFHIWINFTENWNQFNLNLNLLHFLTDLLNPSIFFIVVSATKLLKERTWNKIIQRRFTSPSLIQICHIFQ